MTRKATEHKYQCAVIRACKLLEFQYPELKYLYAVPNGSQRHIAVAVKLKAEGVKRGVPDLVLPVMIPNGPGSLYIEMKSDDGKPTETQQDYLRFLHAQGFEVHICRAPDEAITHIKDYMERYNKAKQAYKNYRKSPSIFARPQAD